MCKEEFLTLICLNEAPHDKISSGTKEMAKVLRTLESRKLFPNYATLNKLILEENGNRLWTLSPSQKDEHMTKKAIKNLIPSEGSSKPIRSVPISPNQCSIVACFEIGKTNLLFGADMENSTDEQCGWKSILKNGKSIKQKKSSFLKVPHHGSSNAYNGDLWNKYLIESPSTVLTPYNRSHLPKKEDITRIIGYGHNNHIAGKISSKEGLSYYRGAVRKELNSITKSQKILSASLGIVRVVIDTESGKEKSVSYMGDAGPLKNVE